MLEKLKNNRFTKQKVLLKKDLKCARERSKEQNQKLL